MTGKVLHLTKDAIDKVDMSSLHPYMTWNPQFIRYMNEAPGKEHYKMLAVLSSQLDAGSVVSDLGTYYGASALALSYNPDVIVTTYDIFNVIPQQEPRSPLTRPNIAMKIMSCQLDLRNISKSHLVLLDIDPHDGPTETKVVESLQESGFRGILLCDDIFLNDGMTEFWLSIPKQIKKVNVSRFGHWTGTGAVVFDPSFIDLHMVEPEP